MSGDNVRNSPNNNDVRVRVPASLSLRDVVYIIIAIVSITTTFMMYGTRLSVVEEKMLSIGNHLTEIKAEIKEIKKEQKETRSEIGDDLGKLESRLRSLEEHQARLEGLINGGLLKRRKAP
jgi:cell division protein FtsL